MERNVRIIPDVSPTLDGEWLPVHASNDDNSHDYQQFLTLNHNEHYRVEVMTRARLIKWTNDGTYPGDVGQIYFDIAELRYWTAKSDNVPGSPKGHSRFKESRYSRVSVWFNRNDRTCATPLEQTVLLPPAQVSEFSGVGSNAGTVTFDLQLSNCNQVQAVYYKLIPSQRDVPPPPGVPGPAIQYQTYCHSGNGSCPDKYWLGASMPGVLPPRPDSTAGGVHIQVWGSILDGKRDWAGKAG